MPDGWEVKFWLNPNDANGRHGAAGDLDGDDVSNLDEFYYETSPKNTDTDFDGLPDGWEISYGLNPLHNGTEKYILKANFDYYTVSDVSDDDGPEGDPDEDEFDNSDEYGYGTSPTSADSDGDGLIDGNTTDVMRYESRFKLWESQGIPYTPISPYGVRFLGEGEKSTNRTNPDTDNDNATDGQELYGYNVMISWYEGEELKSMNKTIFGDPNEAYMEPDGVTPLDVDEDGIIDIDEIDPWNSSTPAVIEFREHFKNDQDMMDSQFNPFIRESTPPMVINIKVKTHEEWGWTTDFLIPLWVLKRAWSEIDVEAIDVANFSVTVRISPGRIAEFQGEGHEWFKAELDLFFWEVMGKYTVKIEMVDFAGNELDPAYEKEVDGWFGGVLRMLEALWEFICAVASAIADAVMKALSFLADLIMSLITKIIELALAPVYGLVDSWLNGIYTVVERMMTVGDANEVDAQELESSFFSSPLIDILWMLSIAIQVIITILIVASAVIPGVNAAMASIGTLFKTAAKEMFKNVILAVVSWAAGSIVAIVASEVLPDSPVWNMHTGIGAGVSEVIVLFLQLVKYRIGFGHLPQNILGAGDVWGLVLIFLGFFIAGVIGSSSPSLFEQYKEIIAVIGVVLGFFGMVLSWGSPSWSDDLPGIWGLLDEILGTALFGFTVIQATYIFMK